MENVLDFTTIKPWTGAGVDIDQATLATVFEALQLGDLCWEVELQNTFRVKQSGQNEQLSTRAVVRTDIDKVLGVVGSEYHAIQNVPAFSLLNDLVDSHDAVIETVGEFGNGQIAWMMLKLPGLVTIDGSDIQYEKRLFASNAHTGKKSFSIQFLLVNTRDYTIINVPIKKIIDRVYIRHVSTAAVGIKEVRSAVGAANSYFEKASEVLNTLVKESVTSDDLYDILDKILPPSSDGVISVANTAARAAIIRNSIKIGNEYPDIAHTKLSLLHAVCSFADFIRGGSSKQPVRFKSSISGTGQRFKAKAFSIINTYRGSNESISLN